MNYKVRIFHDGKLIEPPDYPKVFISNKTVDRIVNDIYERESGGDDLKRMPVYEGSFGLTLGT